MTGTVTGGVKLSIIIKALNEQDNIARTIESALQAVDGLNAEVILADSLSTDKTVDIASGYPVRIVQLASASDRCCGVGAQLGYQFAKGEYVYILDGDQSLYKDFINEAIAVLDGSPEIAGVGGQVVEKNLQNHEFQSRTQRALKNFRPGVTNSLNTGGLYRRAALDKVGYFTNRNLHSYEEYELAARLRTNGFKLIRLPVVAIDHFGYSMPEYALLKKRWKSGYIMGLGEAIRSALGKPQIWLFLRELRELHLYWAVIGWWFLLLLLGVTSLQVSGYLMLFLPVLMFPVLMMWIKKRNLRIAWYSVYSWNVNTAGLLRGLCRPQGCARQWVDANVIKDI